MNRFSKFESYFAEILSSFPSIKKKIKYVYQFTNLLLFKKKYYFKSTYYIVPISSNDQESFFGYYDKSPDNTSDSHTIFCSTKINSRCKPTSTKAIDIILKNNKNGEEVIAGSTLAYNWQQGSRLQWVTSDKFIFNIYDSVDKEFKACVYNCSNNSVEKIVNFPVYDCYGMKFALSLNFSRLAILRPDYGYRNRNEEIEFNNYNDDGIYCIDLQNNLRKLILPLKQIISICTMRNMTGSRHKVNHIMISPDGKNFIFNHRWFTKNGKKFDRLFVSSIDCKTIRLLSDGGMVSHCCWANNYTIIGFLSHNSFGKSFYKINIYSADIELLSKKLLGFGDGHPSVLGDRMVFDSYPDRSRMKHLYVYDLNNDSIEQIGEFYESLKYFGETRCDLHPKWGNEGQSIYIDSVHENKRMLYKIILKK